MTISLHVVVSDKYRATVIHTASRVTADGTHEIVEVNNSIIDGPAEAYITFTHGRVNQYQITETALGTETLPSGDVIVADPAETIDAADPVAADPVAADPVAADPVATEPAAEPEPAAPDGLESLTIAQLRSLADARNISLSGLTLKDDIIGAIRAAAA